MKYINTFENHASYEAEINGGVDISLPNVSYCKDVKDVHYNPYNTVEFYILDEIFEPTVKIYTDNVNSVDVTVSEVNKWYTYVLPKDKGLYKIDGGYFFGKAKVVVKANITTSGTTIIPSSTVEASFKGSNTSKATEMNSMFNGCSGLISLDVSSFDTSNVTSMADMFDGCSGLISLNVSSFDTSKVTNMNLMFTYCSKLIELDLSGWNISNGTTTVSMFSGCPKLSKIKMVGCSEETITKIEEALTAAGIKDKVTIENT